MLADTGREMSVQRTGYTLVNSIPRPLPYKPFPLNTRLCPAHSARPWQANQSLLDGLDPPSMLRISDRISSPGCCLLHRTLQYDHDKGSTVS